MMMMWVFNLITHGKWWEYMKITGNPTCHNLMMKDINLPCSKKLLLIVDVIFLIIKLK